MSTRDLDGVLAILNDYEEDVQRGYRGGKPHPDYMRNCGRHDAVEEIRAKVLELKRRGGDDDDGSEQRPVRRRRYGVSTSVERDDDWGNTPGEPIDLGPF